MTAVFPTPFFVSVQAGMNTDWDYALPQIRDVAGAPYDLTGAALELQIKNQPGATAGATLSTSDGSLLVPNPANGIVSIAAPLATMEALTPSTYFFDLLHLVSSSSRLLLGTGVLRLTSGVTESQTPRFPPL